MIRAATPADMPRVWELVLELAAYEKLSDAVTGTLEQFSAGLGRDFRAWVAEQEGRIVGYALVFSTYSTFRSRPGLWLEDLYVIPECRGAGLGKQLLLTVIAEAKAMDTARLEWSVLDWNQPSIEFYERLGATVLPDWRFCRISF
jgi:GNAT superfamily N-acetyltransferase